MKREIQGTAAATLHEREKRGEKKKERAGTLKSCALERWSPNSVNAPSSNPLNFASESRVTGRCPRPFHTVFHNTPQSVSSASPRRCLLTAVLRSPPPPPALSLLFLSPVHLPCSRPPSLVSPYSWLLVPCGDDWASGAAPSPGLRRALSPATSTRYARPFASLRFPSYSARPSAPNPK